MFSVSASVTRSFGGMDTESDRRALPERSPSPQQRGVGARAVADRRLGRRVLPGRERPSNAHHALGRHGVEPRAEPRLRGRLQRAVGDGNQRFRGVWALGHYGYREPDSHVMALYLWWDGSEWQVVPGPSGEALHQTHRAFRSIDGRRVGGRERAHELVPDRSLGRLDLVNGRGRSPQQRRPFGASLADVVSISATDAWAVGRYQGPPGQDGAAETFPLIERWDGVSWRVMEAPPLDG